MSCLRIATAFLAALVSLPLQAAQLLDANTASADALADAAGESTAEMIVAARPFDSVGELDSLLAETLDDDEREALYGRLFVPLNLNTASEDDILLIPGVGRRMAHEFEEYRPYTSMEQFRREIGKYVDDDEVARLEMYVTLD